MLTFQPLSIVASFALLALFSPLPDPALSAAPPPVTTLNDPECSISGPNPICVGHEAVFTSFQAGTNFSWSFTFNSAGAFFCGPTNQQTVCVNTTHPGLFRLLVTYTNSTGNHFCAVEPTVVDDLVIAQLQPQSVCPSTDVLFSTSVLTGNGPFGFSWTFDNGSGPVTIPGANTANLLVHGATSANVGDYCVTVTGQCGSAQSCAHLSVKTGLLLADLGSQSACEGDDVVFTANVLAGAGPFTFSWTVDHGSGPAPIPGANASTLALSDVTLADAGVYCVHATGECGSDDACAELSVQHCGGEELCTLTQGAYGSAGGAGNLSSINALLSTDLVVGKPGRSLRILAGNGACVLSRLPANSSPAALPAIGNATLNASSCQTSPVALPLKNGRFKNVFLGQVITLALNTRLSPSLPSLAICGTMKTQKGGDPLDQVTVTIDGHVFTALAAAGLPFTVGGLLELANRALAGQATAPASVSEVNDAVEAINRAFDECRTLISCN